jgi:hypothetical protein
MEPRARDFDQRTVVLRLRNIVENVGSLRKGGSPRKSEEAQQTGSSFESGDARHELRPNALITLRRDLQLVIARSGGPGGNWPSDIADQFELIHPTTAVKQRSVRPSRWRTRKLPE